MTRDEILNMEAGRKLDALIAEKVMGWMHGDYAAHGRTRKLWVLNANHRQTEPPPYSTDIAAAWKVIERIQEIDPNWSPTVYWDDGDGYSEPMWAAGFAYYGESRDQYRDEAACGKSAPLAICRAALLVTLREE